MAPFELAVCGTMVLLIISVFKYALASQRPKDFPPGPPCLPIIGNLHQIPLRKGFLRWQEWGKEYGNIIGFKLGPKNAVVLNSYRHVKELFDKRGAKYSSRPESYVNGELLCPNEIHILFASYGPKWRALRKAVQMFLNAKAVDALHPLQVAESTQTMCDLLDEPSNYYDHIRRYSTAVILASVFGQRGASFQSPKVQALYRVEDRFTVILEPGATPPVDAFGFLKYIPEFLSPWKIEAREIRKEQSLLYHTLLNETKDRIQRKISPPCFMQKVIEDQEKNNFTPEQMAYLGGITMEAGSDTTSSTLLAFVLAMAQHPEILKQAQKEVDRVCGIDRSPNFDDIEKLEYTLRWRPIAPGGIPHMLTEDDSYEGYFIPKGTIVFYNAWAIHMDEGEYDSPEKFEPARWLNNKFGCKSTADIDDDHRRTTYSFGAGRRVCSGQRLAQNSLMLNMAKMVWLFDIRPDSLESLDMDIGSGFTDGIIVAPKKVPIQFVPRSNQHARIIRDELQGSQDLFATYE
ncbi:hypothetical protein N7508_004903 [Penicillium antarcticum]|uniref:uncharacterized protein n=1 Tax=Penicillium antarcticum TaxID=416450 RepID=UPI002397A5D0|nr:uncharacterized protein N7508_004903 [Penicillium antarcticum]KAJ5305888.1 hypothetical protein N7508_004903 [Penicillium antarcticum]